MTGRRGLFAAACAMVAIAVLAGLLLWRPGRDEPVPARSEHWLVTVYYTAVEAFQDGELEPVTGCPVLDCERGDADLGSYPGGFAEAVRDEGTGRITSGPHAGKYLNWSHNVGYWLDSAPRDSAGRALEPFVSAAADPGVLPAGRRFRIADCGRAEDGAAIDPEVCGLLAGASWRISDEFTPGFGGDRHVDVYIGEQTGPGFTENKLYTTLSEAALTLDGS
ncbi:hypothetical protein [Amycolatopsis nigrescens]|uniref:hypothetical protein n=1 Tax=Amycolatopsis nigrescens TaxID=381445 RepID=UPI000379D93F|nr:hypothetical protein [Amycolatopsis nigrescens]